MTAGPADQGEKGEELVSIRFPPETVQDLKRHAGNQQFALFILHAISVYASMADQAAAGFTQIRARNPKTGEERIYRGPVLPDANRL